MTYQTVAAFTQSLSLLIFFGLFIGVVVYAIWPGNSKKFEEASRMPLESDEHDPNATPGTGGRR